MPKSGYLSEETKMSVAISGTNGASGTSAINGAVLDMTGWDGLLVVVQMGPITSTAVTSIKLQQDTVVGMGGAADLLGSNQTIADTDDDKVFYIDIQRPLEQFVRVVVSRGTAAATCMAMYIQYRGRSRPTSAQGTNVAGERFVAPAEGTA